MDRRDLFFRVRKRVAYLLFSRHGRGYGVHSPFFYDFITYTMRNKTLPDVVFKIENVRGETIRDKRKIEIVDLGVGSSVMKGDEQRRVSDIAKYTTIPPKYGRLLYNMSLSYGSSAIIELGTSVGIGAMYMAAGQPNSVVYTIEGCPSVASIAKRNFEAVGMSNIKLVEGNFDEALPEILKSGVKPGLVFIDGNHKRKAVMRYFNMIADVAQEEAVVVVDDIDYSIDMGEAWKEIQNHDRVTSTIDLNRMGIAFFKRGLSMNNFIVRY